MECNRPEDGTVYNIIQKCSSTNHYMLRSLKNKQHSELKVSVSKRILKTRNTDYWKTVTNIKRRNFNLSLIVDGVIGNVNMLHFVLLETNTIICREKCLYIDVVDSHLHCQIITKSDVKKAIHNLQTNTIDEGSILFSNNVIHGTDLLYLYLSMLFNYW